MASSEDQNDDECGCIQLITCVEPKPEEKDNPQYIPQLEVNKKAMQIIAERFRSPISIIVYVGNMGVGKSKLATSTVAALENEPHDQRLGCFQSGIDPNGITKGVWMWREPLQHPGDTEYKKGSILILDCEGMGDLDENTGSNLYLFCMVVSTAFSIILRPPRIEKNQCNRIYEALHRFERMGTPHILPNVWLMPLDLPDFAFTDPITGDDVITTKEEWINRVFLVDEEHNHLSNFENERLRERYQYIHRMLPTINAVNIDYLPRSLMPNVKARDVHSLIRNEASSLYFQSINTAISALLESAGKRFPGSIAEHMFMRPSELAHFMSELINNINQDKVPNLISVIEKGLADRFTDEIENESLVRFKHDCMAYAINKIRTELKNSDKPLTEALMATINKQMEEEHKNLKRSFLDNCVGRLRCEILGIDEHPVTKFQDDQQREKALREVPTLIQHRLKLLEAEMDHYQEPKEFIKDTNTNVKVTDLQRQKDAMAQLVTTYEEKLAKIQRDAERERLINESLKKADIWRVGVAPCRCGASGGAYNMLHLSCNATPHGNLYYFNDNSYQMVCNACRIIINRDPRKARCNKCERPLRVTKLY